MKRLSATVRVLPLPDFAPGAVRVEVDCRRGTTGMTQIPAPGCPELAVASMVTILAYRHAGECGGCDLVDVHARGDRDLYELVERLAEDQRARFVRASIEERRN